MSTAVTICHQKSQYSHLLVRGQFNPLPELCDPPRQRSHLASRHITHRQLLHTLLGDDHVICLQLLLLHLDLEPETQFCTIGVGRLWDE